MPNNCSPYLAKGAKALCTVACAILAGCASTAGTAPDSPAASDPASTRSSTDPIKTNDSERLMAERLRHCQEERRRLELTLKENQKRTDELQKKLDALLAIDRDLRSRGKNR
jgi:hypothetical protein